MPRPKPAPAADTRSAPVYGTVMTYNPSSGDITVQLQPAGTTRTKKAPKIVRGNLRYLEVGSADNLPLRPGRTVIVEHDRDVLRSVYALDPLSNA